MDLCVGCELDSQKYKHPLWIPAPSENLKGCIISRDPTSDFIDPLNGYKAGKGNLQFDAPPKWLCQRIQYFMGNDLSSTDMNKIHKFLDNQCYWTHFHKCPTSKKDKKYPRFSFPNGKTCADRWFNHEFLKYNLKHKIIILLGRDLQSYFKNMESRHLLQDNTVIYLPHPSRANCGNGWSWKKNKLPEDRNQKEIENKIFRLLSFIEE
ncbi:uracil-DNA glycosylase family protein [Methanoregula sp.]|uniref:uracil-DNA glycosylase family protein n=1 Tax=Methanoregula sp. TaxID=2052170 RepID=UPI0025F17C33|nr:uracil-DNA glycosylase family protein [Methanoregula sp.]